MNLSEARRWKDSPDPSVRAEARRVLAARSSRSRRTAPKRKPGREAKEAQRNGRKERAAEIRGFVMGRARGYCEWCRCPSLSLEWHHVLSGGERRPRESVETTAAVCRYCHHTWHHSEVSTLRNAMEWATVHGFKDALRAIEKRIAKVQEARAAQHPSPPATLTGADDER
jgi:hypothetical protein